jgi:transposase
MMGRKSGQIEMLIFNPEDVIPSNHLLRKIDRIVSFEYIYDLLKPTYSQTGRPSVDPVSLVKMLLHNEYIQSIIKTIRDLDNEGVQDSIVIGLDVFTAHVKNIKNADIIAGID